MFNEILAVLLLINMTMSAPESEPDCYYDQVLGKGVCDNTNYCNWNNNTSSWECQTGRKKREAEPEAREKREANQTEAQYPVYYPDPDHPDYDWVF